MKLTCDQCGREMDSNVETVWNLVEGWEKKRDAGGTNHLALRKPKDVVRCNGCMTLILAGLDPRQETLAMG